MQYGCGWSAPKEWRNFDVSLTLRFEKLPFIGSLYTKNVHRFPVNVEYGDIVKGLPVLIESCKGIYCSHVLEHLSLEDFRTALSNTYKVLEPGGTFRFVLPDLEHYINRYVVDHANSAAIEFMRATSLGHERRLKGLTGFFSEWLGNSQHLWMWDYKSVQEELKNAGFVEVRRAYFGDSSDPMFEKVEVIERWENCLGVECRKLR